jgi:hypothetical protein
MTVKLSNNVRSSLRTTLEIGDTTLNLPVGHGVRFPALGAGEYFYVTVEDAAGDSEILQATARVTDTLTVVRGAEGTTPREFVAGSILEMRVTAASVLDAAQDAADAVDLADLGVTASAVELNVLDGVTASTAELNILDGVTADASEINVLDGVLASTAELNILDGVTASTAELNILDGVTASASELNVLDGITASTAELNILDGVTATTAELNILDGVTTFGGGLLTYADESAFKAGVNLEIGVDVQAYDADTLKGDVEDQTISGGARITIKDLGDLSGNTITPDPGDRPTQKVTNNGAGSILPGSNEGSYTLIVVNASGAGTITTTGWTLKGSPFDTTATSVFICSAFVYTDAKVLSVLKVA